MISLPSKALSPNDAVRAASDAVRGASETVANVLSSVRRRVMTFAETRVERRPALAGDSTRILAGLQWIREYDQDRYTQVEDAIITLADAQPGFQPENYDGCEGVARLAQEVGANLEAFFAKPPVAHPVAPTAAETARAFAEIFGPADRAFLKSDTAVPQESGFARIERPRETEKDLEAAFSGFLDFPENEVATAA